MAEPAGTTITGTPGAPEAASAPPRQPAGNRYRRWRARGLVVLMIVFAALIAWTILQSQATRDATLDLAPVTLTAQSVPIMTSLPGLVTAVDVEAGDRVTSGQKVGEIEVTTTNSQGKAVVTRQVLKAPRAGVVVDDPMPVGSTLQPGVGFLELYDPSEVTLVAEVPLSYLPEIAPGMTADLKAENVAGHIEAVVKRAVPRVESDETSELNKNRAKLVLVPKDVQQVSRLIPGLRFTGTIDTRTGSGDEPVTVYVG
jgi:multidrug resistance efflux pump